MIVYVFSTNQLRPVATLTHVVSANLSLPHDEIGQASIEVLLDDPQVLPLITNSAGQFDLEMVLTASSLYYVVVRDARGRLRMQGKATLELSLDGHRLILQMVDILDELRLIPLPPLSYFNGSVTDIVRQVLTYAPPGPRRVDIPSGSAVVVDGWSLGDVTYALNSWTTLDASRMSLLEAIIAVTEQTGNHFRLKSNGERQIHIQQNPPEDRVNINIVKGGFAASVPADSSANLIGEPTMTVEDDTIIAGLIPEGGSYRSTDNVDRVLRLDGTEDVPEGYRLENVHGYWGVFNEAHVGNPALSEVPRGVIRVEVFSNIAPLTNTDESISAVLEGVDGVSLKSAAFAGYPNDHWKGGTASFTDDEATVVSSVNDIIVTDVPLQVSIGDAVDVSVTRAWDEALVADSRQSLAGMAVAHLDAHSKAQISWSVRIGEVPGAPSEARVRPGDRVRLIYSGSARWRDAHSDVKRAIPSLAVSQVFFVQEMSIVVEDGQEYYDLVLVDNLRRFPSQSGLREMMYYMQRRLPGARMGREGNAYTEQYIVNCDVAGGCSLGFLGATEFDFPFRSPPQVAEVKPLRSGVTVSVSVSTSRISVCASNACQVRVSIVPKEREPISV